MIGLLWVAAALCLVGAIVHFLVGVCLVLEPSKKTRWGVAAIACSIGGLVGSVCALIVAALQ